MVVFNFVEGLMMLQKRCKCSSGHAGSRLPLVLACGLIIVSSLVGAANAASVSFSNSVVIGTAAALDAPTNAYSGAVLAQAVNFGTAGQMVDTGSQMISFVQGTINGGAPAGMTTSMFRAGSENNADLFPGDTGDAGLNAILRSQAWANGGNAASPEILRIGDLTPGQAYVAQLLASDGRTGSADRTQRYNDTADYSGNQSDSFSVQMPTYVLASFTADASGYQDIFIQDTRVSGWDTTFAGFQLHSVPEPTSLMLFAVGAAAILARRKRQ
jgi:PEP-CTERM motif